MDPTTPTPTAQATSTTEPAEQTVQIHNSNINHPLQPTPNGPTSAEDGQRPRPISWHRARFSSRKQHVRKGTVVY
ncbi:hypothetical protein DACRYDRAFT_19403 [Dacryopinax primogenitus]|uniref:Uncharacterized protein n=1 Tax=Dacryopinax primogenitus (strain DJM 731) TaxID=1858805 RepID=M5G788_DACPD|nr:uncharacterized protein DACRYDRAFT_19403 [Dacryopinax primogenitus]EJU06101.1 hypothetical protein DACRYDRAFT_19403 [Dacryopinax primogenitus]